MKADTLSPRPTRRTTPGGRRGARHKSDSIASSRASGAVLAPVDFSPESLRALEYAAVLLNFVGGSLHLVHVNELDYTYDGRSLVGLPRATAVKEIERHFRKRLSEVAAGYSIDPPAQTHVKIGRAFDGICKLADEIRARLIVISTHGRTGLKRAFLGSTAERVVRHAPCPVLVVRDRERVLADVPSPRLEKTSPHKMKILVPLDFSQCSLEGLSYALSFGRPWNAEFILLHTIDIQAFVTPDHYAAYERMPSLQSLEKSAKRDIAELTRRAEFKDVRVETAVEVGRPADQICRYAAEHDVDLIVTSTHGHTGFMHVLIGSVAEHVVRHAHCPVLVVPRRRQTASAARNARSRPTTATKRARSSA